MRIGFIGLGHMGLPMALNLQAAGFEVTGFDLNPAALQAFANAGGKVATTLVDAAMHQAVVITMLQTGAQVSSVCLGDLGIFAHMQTQSLHIDCSTIDVATSKVLHQAASVIGLLAVDAPVSGGVAGAVEGTLTLMMGGELEAVMRAKQVLQHVGKTMIHTGKAGTGQAAKVCNNMVLAMSMIAVSEAFVLADTLGLSKEKLHEVLSNASGQCWVVDKYVPVSGILKNVPANRDYAPGFTSAMMLKDLLLAMTTAKDAQLSLNLANTATMLYQHMNDKGHGALDFSAIIREIE